jgi:DNA-binding transcriptional LysR family regulator
MEWQQILGFSQVAKLGSFTRAAAATFRTQSALTQQVKALEEEWDCQLLERIGKRKLRLTPAGERFLAFAEAVLERYDSFKEELAALKGLPRGHLRLAAPFTTLYHLLPEIFKTYLAQFPQVELTILDRPQGEVLALVHGGEVDFGLALESRIPQNLSKIRWKKVHTVLLVRRDHPLTQVKRVRLQQVAADPLILPPQSPADASRQQLEELFKKETVAYKVVMESSNVELTSVYVAMGLGISFARVSEELVGQGRGELAFIKLDHYFPPDYIAVALRKDKILPPYKSAFLHLLGGDLAQTQ